MLLLGGIGLYLAMINPPYQQDESSHVGYALALRGGQLPAIDTPVPTQGASRVLHLALQRPYPYSDPEIHVANNPPFPYAAAVPFVTVVRWTGLPGGSAFGFRLLHVAMAVGSLITAYLLGRELAGGDELVGLVTAGLLAGVLSIAVITSLANVGGFALLATTGATWALARYARTRSLRHATELGLWCAAAAAVRPMSAAYALAAAGLAVVVHLRGRGWRTVGPVLGRVALPMVVLTGWFYALNTYRYGDPTGSAGLFDKYDTAEGPGFFHQLFSGSSLVQPLDYLLTDVYGRDPWWTDTGPDKWAVTLGALAVVAAALVVVARSGRAEVDGDGGHASGQTGDPRLCRTSWAVVVVLAAVPVVLITQHTAGGGAGHPRYLLPMLPVLAAATALVATRIHRMLGVAAVVAMVGFELQRVRAAGHLRVGPGPKLFGPELNTPMLGQPYRAGALLLVLAGAVLLVASTLQAAGGRPTLAAVDDADGDGDGPTEVRSGRRPAPG